MEQLLAHELVKFRRSRLLTLNMIQEMKDDKANLDSVTIRCKDGQNLEVSRLLLSVISPNLKSLMESQQQEVDYVIIVPDLEATTFNLLFNHLTTEDKILSQDELFSPFEGILWTRDYMKNLGIEISRDYWRDVTRDEDLMTEDVIKFETEGDMIKSEPEDNKSNQSDPVDSEDVNCPENDQNGFMNGETGTERNNISSRKSKRKKTLNTSSDELNEGKDAVMTRKRKRMDRQTKTKKNNSVTEMEKSDIESKKVSRTQLQKRKKIHLAPNCDSLKDKDFIIHQERLKKDLEDEHILDDPFLLWHHYHGLDPNIYDLKNQVGQPPLVCPICNIHFTGDEEEKNGAGMTSFSIHLRTHKLANFTCPCKPGFDEHGFSSKPGDGQDGCPCKPGDGQDGLPCKPEDRHADHLCKPGEKEDNVPRKPRGCEDDITCKPVNGEHGDYKDDRPRKHGDGGYITTPGINEADHLKLVHWNWKQCQDCSEIVEPSRMPFHMLSDHKQPLKCTICSKSLTSNTFRGHMDKHSIQKKSSCGCKIKFKGEDHREHHMQVKHLKLKVGCKKCYFLCSTKSELIAHQNEKHKKGTGESSRVFCDICGKTTTRCLAFHKKLFHDPVLFDCELCPKKFNEAKMRIHVRRCHNERVCTICGVKVKDLLLHTRNKHTPVEQLNYKCEHCPKGFTYKAVLDRHMMNIHLKERPHKCRYGCGAAYNCSSNRNGHERKKHGQVFTALAKQNNLV